MVDVRCISSFARRPGHKEPCTSRDRRLFLLEIFASSLDFLSYVVERFLRSWNWMKEFAFPPIRIGEDRRLANQSPVRVYLNFSMTIVPLAWKTGTGVVALVYESLTRRVWWMLIAWRSTTRSRFANLFYVICTHRECPSAYLGCCRLGVTAIYDYCGDCTWFTENLELSKEYPLAGIELALEICISILNPTP